MEDYLSQEVMCVLFGQRSSNVIVMEEYYRKGIISMLKVIGKLLVMVMLMKMIVMAMVWCIIITL